jgi:hypothetical protein
VRTAPREQQAEALSLLFYGGDMSPETRQILIAGENPLAAKAVKDSTSTLSGLRAGVNQIPLQGLSQMIALALGAPEFQRR